MWAPHTVHSDLNTLVIAFSGVSGQLNIVGAEIGILGEQANIRCTRCMIDTNSLGYSLSQSSAAITLGNVTGRIFVLTHSQHMRIWNPAQFRGDTISHFFVFSDSLSDGQFIEACILQLYFYPPKCH